MTLQDQIDNLSQQVSAAFKSLSTLREETVDELISRNYGDEIANNITIKNLLLWLLRQIGTGVDVEGGAVKLTEEILSSDTCQVILQTLPVIIINEYAQLTDSLTVPPRPEIISELIECFDKLGIKVPIQTLALDGDLAILIDRLELPNRPDIAQSLAASGDNCIIKTPAVIRPIITESAGCADSCTVILTPI